MRYTVTRSYTKTEYIEGIEAESEDEALDIAMKGEWESNPNDIVQDYDYNVEEE